MLSPGIKFKPFKNKKKVKKIKDILDKLLVKQNQVLVSLGTSYKYSYDNRYLKKFKNSSNIRIIGMGGSTLGAQAIYDFLRYKVKKKFTFIDNLISSRKKDNKKLTNIIISKSGNTTETIVNANILIKKKDKNIFLTEDKPSYLNLLASKLKADIIHHNDFIGGRYSVLSEVGMLPAELMGLNPKKFKQLNFLIKKKSFINSLISSVSATLYFIQKKKYNSIIINYDEKSENLFKWYQQLVAESLGKKNSGILPVVSIMPRDNHSVMQLYLDGFKNNFFTFFYTHENKSKKINKSNLLLPLKLIENKNISNILFAQKKATENVFNKNNIPFRIFEVKKKAFWDP